MCDTAVVLPPYSKDGKVYFAKNSDRDPNEAHYVEIVPGMNHSPESVVKCTYMEIPQVPKTNAVLLARPYWIWGAEMGVNEFGVAIGNEAVFTKVHASRDPGLIGMDFLRLALERSSTSGEALQTIIDLLEKYGQGGNCSAEHELYYSNSFLIADRKEAWVLETAGNHWAALKVRDFYTISNALTISDKWDMASDDLVDFALERKWCKNRNDFSFKDCYSDFLFTHFSQAKKRRRSSENFVRERAGKIEMQSMFNLLRLHNGDGEWSPDESITEWTVCMHKGFGPFRASQTVGSLAARLSESGDLVFCTATSAPCTSIFKPVWLESGIPLMNKEPGNYFHDDDIWWRHEKLHREIIKDYRTRIKVISSERDSFEEEMYKIALKKKDSSVKEKADFTEKVFQDSRDLDDKWLELVRSRKIGNRKKILFNYEWRKHNQNAKIYFS